MFISVQVTGEKRQKRGSYRRRQKIPRQTLHSRKISRTHRLEDDIDREKDHGQNDEDENISADLGEVLDESFRNKQENDVNNQESDDDKESSKQF